MIVRMKDGFYLNVFLVFAVETVYENGNEISVFLKCEK